MTNNRIFDYSFVIRKAALDDAEAIRDIVRDSFAMYFEAIGITGSLDALQESLEDIRKDIESKEVFIAFIDQTPVGTVRVKLNLDGNAYISRFGVRTNYHNIGIGKSLLNLVDKLMAANECKSVSLHTAAKNSDLIRFYYGRGFYVDSTTKDHGYIRALMVKEYK